MPAPDIVDRFIDAATSDGRRAWEMLKAYPDLSRAGFYAWLVLGGAEGVALSLTAQPYLAIARSGPHQVEPLVYVCFSRFGHARSPRARRIVATARVLLEAGADPNTRFHGEDGPLSCLYAASGLLGNAGLTQLLLEAGADPDDGESLYHATEHDDLTCLKLLLAHGARVTGSNALKHMLDRESAEGLSLLLAAGGDPNETNPQGDTALHWAVRRGRGTEIVRILIDHGAVLDARREDGRTAYALAVASGQTEVAQLLAASGADKALGVLDAYLAGRGPPPALLPPDSGRLLTHLAEAGRTAQTARLLKAGAPVDAKGDGGITALHYACWRGHVDMIRLLLDRGAPVDVRDDTYGGSPAGFLHHGATHCGEGDYATGARLLIAAGGWNETTPTGHPELDAVLREHGLIT